MIFLAVTLGFFKTLVETNTDSKKPYYLIKLSNENRIQ